MLRTSLVWIEPGQFPFGYGVPNMYQGSNGRGVLMPRSGPLMAAHLARSGYHTTVMSGEVMPLDVDEIAQRFPTACISVLSNTAPHGLVLAKQLADRGVRVIMGGYHFAHNITTPDTLAQTVQALRYSPLVVRGEGFKSLPILLDCLARNESDLSHVGGLSWTVPDGTIVHNPMGEGLRRDEYADLPPANWLAVEHHERMLCLGVHGMFGCPRDCSFCAIWKRDGNGVNKISPEAVVDEIVEALRLGTFKHLFFTSDNFPITHKWAREVCEEMIRRDVRVDWSCQGEARIIVQHPDLVRLMAMAGCVRICMGIESIQQNTLSSISKGGQNQQMIEEAIRICHRYGIAVHGMFIVGLPGDTHTTAENTRRWAIRNRIETAQFLCISDFPGSPDYEDNELWKNSFRPFPYPLDTLSWLFDNGHYARMGNETMGLADVQNAMLDAMRRFYPLRRVLTRPLVPNLSGYMAARRRGKNMVESVYHSVRHQVIASALGWRGHHSIAAWTQHPLNNAYRSLIAATPGSADANVALNNLLDQLPAGWVETLSAT